ncbi:MAG: response regulator [Anaerolineae bacterium]|nr:response regulator [Anaerolineae bacterium]
MIEILLADHNPEDVQYTQEVFKDFKILNRLTITKDGGSTLAYLQGEGDYQGLPTPDLIFLDLDLPPQSSEVLTAIQQSNALREIPVVALIPQARLDDFQQALESATYHILKPLTMEALVSVLQRIDHLWLSIVRQEN